MAVQCEWYLFVDELGLQQWICIFNKYAPGPMSVQYKMRRKHSPLTILNKLIINFKVM
jgi:hypothetical protein